MIRVFADSFYYFALLNARDQAHAAAAEFARRDDVQYVTTAWVLTELADGLSTVAGRGHFTRLLDSLLARPELTEIIPPSPPLFDDGVRIYRDRPDKSWSLTDCISFAAMQSYGLTEALTGDRHFEQAGYRRLLVER